MVDTCNPKSKARKKSQQRKAQHTTLSTLTPTHNTKHAQSRPQSWLAGVNYNSDDCNPKEWQAKYLHMLLESSGVMLPDQNQKLHRPTHHQSIVVTLTHHHHHPSHQDQKS